MRRLLASILALGLFLGSAAPALAAGRVPSGVTRVSVTLTFEPASSHTRGPQHATFSQAAGVSQIVRATDALKTATIRGACPMIMRVGPTLTVVYRDSKGTALAEATVLVANGSRGDSGSSACFPIHYSSGGKGWSLVGNGFIRMIGRMLGTPIS